MTAGPNESEKGFSWQIKFKLWANNGWKLARIKVSGDYFKGTPLYTR